MDEADRLVGAGAGGGDAAPRGHDGQDPPAGGDEPAAVVPARAGVQDVDAGQGLSLADAGDPPAPVDLAGVPGGGQDDVDGGVVRPGGGGGLVSFTNTGEMWKMKMLRNA